MATLYFNDDPAIGGAEDADWDTIDNWWTNEACTTQASNLPTSSDSVVVKGVSALPIVNSGTEPTIVNLTEDAIAQLDMDLTVTGLAIFEQLKTGRTLTGDAIILYISGGTVDGDATISGGVESGGIVTGVATFTTFSPGDGLLDGTVGSAYFYNSAQCGSSGIVSGNAYYYDSSSSNTNSTVGGNAEYYDYSHNVEGQIVGTGTWNDGSSCERGSEGAATFNDDSVANGYEGIETSPPNATFNDRSRLEGFVSTHVIFNDYARSESGAQSDVATFNDQSYGTITILDTITINGSPVVFQQPIDAANTYDFVRRSGINGSSILGVA